MQNISGFGLIVQLTADSTFPTGVTIGDFADDSDPLDTPEFTAADTGVGLNGDMVVWNRAGLLEVVLSVIPTSESDNNLEVLLDANRTGKNKSSARDKVGMVIVYPDGRKAMAKNGTIVSGPLTPAVQSTGRMRSRQYRFRFETVTKAKAPSA